MIRNKVSLLCNINYKQIILNYLYDNSIMSVDKGYIERARIIFARMSLEELLAEENLMQRYIFKHSNEEITKRLYIILSKEIEKRLR